MLYAVNFVLLSAGRFQAAPHPFANPIKRGEENDALHWLDRAVGRHDTLRRTCGQSGYH